MLESFAESPSRRFCSLLSLLTVRMKRVSRGLLGWLVSHFSAHGAFVCGPHRVVSSLFVVHRLFFSWDASNLDIECSSRRARPLLVAYGANGVFSED
ncbi:hypothetical protein EXIGLDRAFT_386544 [Exidia glandulosa HHB12029]|uniref:Uncharacterized protein n=1 Tax=Exidia glandulosa HHB12029 TaxID=1314781 RepID=A0A165L0T9_EXIGL|nr:hypothetical protein EXIGLDRAFT_386544 [Exidia glandulosa HHB12029]